VTISRESFVGEYVSNKKQAGQSAARVAHEAIDQNPAPPVRVLLSAKTVRRARTAPSHTTNTPSSFLPTSSSSSSSSYVPDLTISLPNDVSILPFVSGPAQAPSSSLSPTDNIPAFSPGAQTTMNQPNFPPRVLMPPLSSVTSPPVVAPLPTLPASSETEDKKVKKLPQVSAASFFFVVLFTPFCFRIWFSPACYVGFLFSLVAFRSLFLPQTLGDFEANIERIDNTRIA